MDNPPYIQHGNSETFLTRGILVGAKGALYLYCRHCGKEFGTFLRYPLGSVPCHCGGTIELDILSKYAYTCPCCGKQRFGMTNSEGPEISLKCVCGNHTTIKWDKKRRCYR